MHTERGESLFNVEESCAQLGIMNKLFVMNVL